MDSIIPASTATANGLVRRDVQVAAATSQVVPPASAGAKDGEQRPASAQDVHTAVEAFKTFVQDVQRNLDFSVDDSTGQMVVRVMDGDSGKLIRQIPSEELLRLSERLEDMHSLLFKAQA